MTPRYRALVLYSLLLALAASSWLVVDLPTGADFPPLWVAALCVAACLFVWQFGLPVPRVGLASMERLPQIGLLLVLSPPVAAALCGIGSLVWPLFNRDYSQGSLRVAVLRGIHNASMTALMLLLAGEAYLAAGGEHPLRSLERGDIWPLTVMAMTVQGVNVSLLTLYFWLDGRDVRRLIKPIYSLIDLIFVPAGVLAALLYNSGSPAAFGLFAALMGVFVISFNQVDRALGAAASQNAPLEILSSARKALHGARRIDELGNRILTETRALFRFAEFQLALVNHDAQMLDVRVHERNGQRRPGGPRRLNSGLLGWVVERGQAVLIDDWAIAPDELRHRAEPGDRESGSLIAVPLIEDGAVIGVLSIQHAQPGAWSRADLHLMQQLAEQVAAAVADARAFEDLERYRKHLEERVAERTDDLEQANREKERLITALRERSRALERESQEDPLTGIANRRHFSQRLDAEIEVALSVGQPLTLAVADLDHFKIVNDRLGHAVGDEVLRQSAMLMRQLCRSTDLVARIGGEEFALILPGMTRIAAISFCENLRHAVESHDWGAVHPGLAVTLSIGLSQWNGSAETAELLQAADAQMYRAKHAGRNRVA
ncbi:MAG: diguanylate cyclase [Woeseiaceae bacterium]